MRSYRLTAVEFARELERAAEDDRKWPNLKRRQYLLDHATSRDGEILLRLDCDHAPGKTCHLIRD